MNRRDGAALVARFAEEATLHHPTGIYRGHEQIRDFYERLVFHAGTTIRVKHVLAAGEIAIAEILGTSPFAPTPVYVVDVFEVNDRAQIVELTVYVR